MRYFIIILVFLVPSIVSGQLSAPGVNAIRHTVYYPSAPKAGDPIFIFCNSTGTQKGSLTASSPSGTGPFNFTWYKWSDVTKTFSTLIKSDPGVASSSADDLDQGGYKVTISGGFDTSLVGWVFLDKPFVSAALQNFTCDYVALKGQVAIDTFNYNSPADGARVELPNKVSFLWSSDPPSVIPYPDFLLNPQTFDPPLVDVNYKLQVSDSFGCLSESSFFYKSIHAKADFTVSPDNGQAPLEVTFTDMSVRGSSYKWEFGDTTTSELQNPPPHIYYIPGDYSVKLTIVSDLHCVDSLRLPKKIHVEPSELHIPNVFTPDGDGINDNFIVESKSLRDLTMEVYSRSGLKVYSFSGEGNRLKNWTGWDGNVNSTSVKASPGVYFYIVRAHGWDNINYNSKEYRGFVYLYR